MTVLNGYTISGSLGSGKFGNVYKVANRYSIYAMKEVANVTNSAVQEAAILKTINHPNIVKYVEAFLRQNGVLYIVMEFAGRGILSNKENLSLITNNETNIWKFLKQMASALNTIHGMNIIHRDLKPNNILCTNTTNGVMFKIADFGIAYVFGSNNNNQAAGYCGSYCYVAPEILRGQQYTNQVDMWSLGAIMSFVCNGGVHLFPNDQSVLNWSGQKSTLPKSYSYNLRSVVAYLLDPRHVKRGTAAQISCMHERRQTVFGTARVGKRRICLTFRI